MAIGADGGLPTLSQRPLAQPPAAKRRVTPQYDSAPPVIADRSVQAAVNNQLAASAGGGRTALQGLDRAGMSRGRGQAFRADMAQAEADATARAGAAQTEMGAAAANAGARNAYDFAMRSEGMGNDGLLEGLRSTAAMSQIGRAERSQNASEAMRRGRFGLDSIQLDYSPLLQALMR
jgi:hypothetical protein